MEGQQLQGDDAQDALQAVHAVRYFDGAAGVSDGLLVVFVADDDGTPLQKERDLLKKNYVFWGFASLKHTSATDY